MRLVGQEVKTPPSHGGIRGSIPLRAARLFFKNEQPNPEEPRSDNIRRWCFSCVTGKFFPVAQKGTPLWMRRRADNQKLPGTHCLMAIAL